MTNDVQAKIVSLWIFRVDSIPDDHKHQGEDHGKPIKDFWSFTRGLVDGAI